MIKSKITITEQMKRVAQLLDRDKFGRAEFFKNSEIPITRDDIENAFGSFANAMKLAGLRPQRHHKISTEELFKAYETASEKLGHFPLGHKGEAELYEITSISGYSFRERFKGGLKSFLFEFKNWKLNKESKDIDVTGIKEEIVSLVDDKQVSVKIESEYFDNKQRYAGRGAENLVVAELLFRGFNAQILQVDEGIDVFAINKKKNELYLIQVKHSHYENPKRSGSISLTVSSFEKNKKSNVYYIFVLEREMNKHDFLILPFHKVDELIKNGSMNKADDSKQISFCVLHKDDEDVFISKIGESSSVSRYLNAWDVLL